ncbi:hypothetical protein [Pseudonocardia abyssalis]|uniref:Uncharacterized protein n=1 Tax=Pseudonocardia abyssalis TaxID=2792008 RepID=A0ABS6UTR9_9PSEU|nr:hypothetical protein [Pseudonocardia abyssalis]MBW0115335.1 hypothetical protein [Pseudonocardia abyssalis]MBW0135651.1 hypothetical protein [Pseudonocardia abyssalis]
MVPDLPRVDALLALPVQMLDQHPPRDLREQYGQALHLRELHALADLVARSRDLHEIGDVARHQLVTLGAARRVPRNGVDELHLTPGRGDGELVAGAGRREHGRDPGAAGRPARRSEEAARKSSPLFDGAP